VKARDLLARLCTEAADMEAEICVMDEHFVTKPKSCDEICVAWQDVALFGEAAAAEACKSFHPTNGLVQICSSCDHPLACHLGSEGGAL
jgi:hypothetical protein